MIENQEITYVRGKDLLVPVTLTLDQGRSLDGDETWTWVCRKSPTSAVLVTLTDAGGTITKAGPSFSPILVLRATEFLLATFPAFNDPQYFVHALEMSKDAKKEPVYRGQLKLLTPIVP